MTLDAFAHLPGLRDRVTPAEQSAVRITPEALALWDRRARQLGQPENWRLSEQQIEDSRCAILGQARTTQDLWIYGYGSLMWDPGFHFVEVRRADLPGFARRFSYKTVLGRGTPECPALTLSLEPAAGCCHGLAFRIAAELVDTESAILWRREMIRGGYSPTLLPVATPQGNITALVFASNRSHPGYVGELPLDEAAAIIASASGVLGTNRDYLDQLSAQLAALEIDDAYIRQLRAQVLVATLPRVELLEFDDLGHMGPVTHPDPVNQAVAQFLERRDSAEREFVHQRLIDAPRERVFRAFSDPAQLARWWGPNGFSSSFQEFDLRSGGAWRFVMHGPDGTDYPNESVFAEVVAPERIVFEHLSDHHFQMTLTFEARGNATLLGWRQRFDTAAERERIAAVVIAANEQNLDRLAAWVRDSP